MAGVNRAAGLGYAWLAGVNRASGLGYAWLAGVNRAAGLGYAWLAGVNRTSGLGYAWLAGVNRAAGLGYAWLAGVNRTAGLGYAWLAGGNRKAGLGCAWLVGLMLAGCAAGGPPALHARWLGAWGFSPMPFTVSPVPGANSDPAAIYEGVTVRQIVRLSGNASRVRIRFSNEFGSSPLRLEAAHLALAGEDGRTVTGTDHVLRFAGHESVIIPANAPMVSDAVEWDVPGLSRLAVSSYLPLETQAPAHRISQYVSSTGNFVAAESLPGATLNRSGALVTRVEIVSRDAARTVVTLGDSITEGFGSSVNAFRGWPDRLAERLAHASATPRWTVVNAGINSNRLLHDGPGTGALARFDRDVLGVPGIKVVLLLEGINDIGYTHTVPEEGVSADDIIRAYEQLSLRAHSRGVALIAATIPPFEAAHYFDAQGEQMRQRVNAWIRTSGAVDGMVDFDAVLRDPAHPAQVLPSLQRGDHLHPNDAGYELMANSIDLALLTRAAAKYE